MHNRVFFFPGLLSSPTDKTSVAVLLAAKDLRSSLGSNLELVKTETGMDSWAVGRAELRAALDVSDRGKCRRGTAGYGQRYTSCYRGAPAGHYLAWLTQRRTRESLVS